MTDSIAKTAFLGLTIAGVAVLGLILAGDFGWMTPAYRDGLRTLMMVVIFAMIGVRYMRDKDSRSRYRAYLLWALVISVPMVTMGFLRDSWQNGWFQTALFPSIFVPVMIATILGYAALAFVFFRSMQRAK
jgi:hypothetical protein